MKKRFARLGRLNSFTLVEILISLFILGVGITFSSNLFLLGWQSLSHSKQLNDISLLAQKKLEELKAKGVLGNGENTSGKEGNLNWSLATQALTLPEAIEVVYVELDIESDAKTEPQKQTFITYLF